MSASKVSASGRPAAWRAAGRAVVECVYAEAYAGRVAAADRLRALGTELRRS